MPSERYFRLEKFKSENIIYKIITLAVLAAAVFFVCRTGYGALRSLPYSRELLEPANVALSNTFLEGGSPYSLESLTWERPGVNYDYPFLNSLLAAGIAALTRCNTVTAHLAISYISIILSGIIGALMVKDHTKTTVAPALTALMFMFCHWRFGYVSAAPDDLGLLILTATLYAAVSPKIRHKSIWCAIGITACFYTKQYFVFVAASIFIYMLLYSRKEAVKLFVITLALNIVAAALITVYWPLYWMRTIAFTYLGTGKGGGGKIATLIDQLDYLTFSFAALFAIIIAAAIVGIRKLKKSNSRLKDIKIKENDPYVLSIVNMIVMLIPLYVLGKNDGAFISYFLQLWMHSVAVVAIISIENMTTYGTTETTPGNGKENNSNIHRYILPAAYAAVAAATVYFGFGRLPMHILTDEEIADWEKAYAYTSQYSKEGEVYYSRSLAYDGFERDNGDWQCGHEGEVSTGTVAAIEDTGIPMEYLPYTDDLVEQNIDYREDITDKAENHTYALITFEPGTNALLLDDDRCKAYGYTKIDDITLQLGNMPYQVMFYAIN